MEYTLSPDGERILNDCPYPSWTQDQATGLWIAPVERPEDGVFYEWDEETLSWVAFEAPAE